MTDLNKGKNVKIILKISTESIVAKDLVHAFDDLEASLYRIDRELVEEISALMELDELLIDAALERVRKHRGQRVIIDRVSEGSIVLELSLAGVVLWVMKNLVGESIRKGWKDSGTHEKLSKATAQSIDSIAMRIVSTLKRSKRGLSSSEITVKNPPDVDEPTIYITQSKSSIKKSDQIPKFGDMVKKIHKK